MIGIPVYVMGPPAECYNENGEVFHFSDDWDGANACKEAMEKADPAKSYVVVDEQNAPCHENACPPADLYVKEGLPRSCAEGKGGEFGILNSAINESNAYECARTLNRLEKAKGTNIICLARNIGGLFVDNWSVVCK